jgi:hypothetical protein
LVHVSHICIRYPTEEDEDEDYEDDLPPELPIGTKVRGLYDYIPEDLSPNDPGEELQFHVHDVMRILEPRDPDGFYKVRGKAYHTPPLFRASLSLGVFML